MKRRTLISIFIVAALLAMAAGAGFLFGRRGESAGSQTVQTGGKAVAKESDRIAVVNLDEGTSAGETNINYAEKMSEFPGINFEYSSLEQARSGFENGQYGAYIVIPATFSKSVESINSTPQASFLEYAVNQTYSGETQYELLYDVISYAKTLNDNLTYMYLDNILSEFHDAQDGASSVMANDLKDKEAIDNIQSYDLVALVEVPELKQDENTTETLDLSEYTEANSEAIQSIDDQYMLCVEEIRGELQMMEESGRQLSDLLTTLSEQVAEINLTVDSQGGSIAEQADAALDQSLKDYVSGAPDKEELGEQLQTVRDSNQYIKDQWLRSGEIYNNALPEKLEGELTKALEAAADNVPGLTVSETGYGQYTVTLENSDKVESAGKAKSADEETAPALTFTLVENELSDQSLEEEALLREISAALAAAENETETIEVPVHIEGQACGAGCACTAPPCSCGVEGCTGGEGCPCGMEGCTCGIVSCTCGQPIDTTVDHDAAKSVKTVLAAFDEKAQALGYDSAAEFLSKYGSGDVEFTDNREIKVEGDADAFAACVQDKVKAVDITAYSISGMTDTLYDEDGNPMTDKNGQLVKLSSLVDLEDKELEEMMEDLAASNVLDIQSVRQLVKEQYVDPVEKNAESAKAAFVQRNEEEKDHVEEYNRTMRSFHPQVNSLFVTENISAMTQNNSEQQTALAENNTAYMDYADKVFQTATENVATLQENLNETKENSDQAVTDGLSAAKGVKEETSWENQEILAAFSAKLPYTRLGSAEYTQAYQFIANPVNTEDLSGESSHKTVVEKTANQDTGSGQEEEDTFPWEAVYIAAGSLIIILIGLLIWNMARRREEQ